MATPGKLSVEIKAGRFKSAYYFFGVDDYRIAEAEKFIAQKFLPNRQLLTNYTRIDARITSCSDLVAEFCNLPLLGERQVLAVRDFQRYKPTEIERILKPLSPSDPNRVVILSSPSSRIPKKRSKFLTTMAQATEVVEFRKLSSSDITRQITTKLKKQQLDIETDARNLLTELLSGSRGGLESEINKLIDYKNQGGTVTVEDIMAISSGYEAYSIFSLADEIIAGETRTVLKIIRSLLSSGNSPVAIGTLLQQHFISLYLVKNGKKPLGNRNFLIPKFRSQATHYENPRLEEIIIEIATTDAEFRRQNIKQDMGLEILALNLTRENM
ncbi:MAG: DNA polymerase III subunit delta [candidate division Zixibacteria bacterium]|nr:DNA polymerase III subunit delta [candidate division Zixibacteria bacterium]